MAEQDTLPASYVSAALERPSGAFTYRFYLSVSLFLLMLFLLHFHYSEVGFFIVVLVNAVFCADIFVRSAWEDLCRLKIGFPALVSVAVYAGFFYSVLHTFLTRPVAGPVGDLYLYVSVFLTLSLWAQGRRVRERERAGIYIKKIDDFLPKSARKRKNGKWCKVFAYELKAGEEVCVKPGERLPCDGIIKQGKTAIDEELITGNMMPAYKQPGNAVYAGTINKSAEIFVTATHPLAQSALMGVIEAVQHSERRRGKFTTDLDVYSAWTFLALLLVAGGRYGWLLYEHGWSSWLEQSGVLLAFLSLGAPVALLFAEILPTFFARCFASSHGIQIQNPYALEQLVRAGTLFFDKTGTLTYGHLTVHEVCPSSAKGEQGLLEAISCAEQHADGPFAAAIRQYARARRLSPRKTDSLDMISGVGVRATSGKDVILAGRIQWIEEQGIRLPQTVYQQDETVICVAKNGVYLGYLTLADSLRPGAKEVIAFLKQQDKSLLLISGDNERSVNKVADEVGIEKRNANVLPKTKAEIVANMRALGKKVVMVGDGFNDILALLNADVGLAFSSGKNIYNNWVDILITRRDLYPLTELHKIYRKMRRISQFNAVFAFVLSVSWVEFLLWRAPHGADWRWTLGGSVGIVLLVFLNSMRLLRVK